MRATRTLLVVTALLSLGLSGCGSNDPDVVVPPGDGLQKSEEHGEGSEDHSTD